MEGTPKKHKLHIFGCSHSGYIFDNDYNRVPFWGEYLANKLDLELYPRIGHPGKNSEYILLDIYDRILNNLIFKNDYVILNTSYPMRFGTPRLQKYSKPILDFHFDTNHILGIDAKNSLKIDELKPDLTFDLWYKQTFGAWKLLKSVSNNVYQWLLDDKTELDFTYTEIQKNFRKENSNSLLYEMCDYPLLDSDFNLNPWKNLLTPPIEEKNWDDWIQKHPRDDGDSHLNPKNHLDFANIFYKQIKEYEIHN